MVFRSYTYDASEVDLQYGLDENGSEIHEAVIDENAFTGQFYCCQGVFNLFGNSLAQKYLSFRNVGV